jgi:hypothetical protein
MSSSEPRKPKVLIPYPGPCHDLPCHDVFVYLRPETNGIEVESVLLRVIHSNPEYKQHLQLRYLANIPGDFIVRRRIIEKYYVLQIYFAVHGREAFTEKMVGRFEEYFDADFESARVFGAFEALKVLNMTYNQLFQLRVPKDDMLNMNGQCIKRYRDTYIVNYDIPAILHKNNNQTDIAVMIFRTDFDYDAIHRVIRDMGASLTAAGTLDPGKPLSRMFHYSKGPFDQIRDAIGYLYSADSRHVSLKRISFSQYLLKRGVTMHQIMGAIRYPLMEFQPTEEEPDGSETLRKKGLRDGLVESDIFTYTRNDSYERAYEKYVHMVSQRVLY